MDKKQFNLVEVFESGDMLYEIDGGPVRLPYNRGYLVTHFLFEIMTPTRVANASDKFPKELVLASQLMLALGYDIPGHEAPIYVSFCDEKGNNTDFIGNMSPIDGIDSVELALERMQLLLSDEFYGSFLERLKKLDRAGMSEDEVVEALLNMKKEEE